MLATVLKGQLVTKATSAIAEDIGFDATGKATKVNELDEIGAELAKERGGEE